MSLKLTYFNMRGRAETCRMVLHAAKKPFTDYTLNTTEWPKLKPKTPFGSLPVLEIGGEQYGQGIALATYLAREYGFYGSNNLEGLQIDQLQQLREDLLVEEIKVHFEKDASKKAELAKNMRDNVYPRYLGYFSKALKDNKAKNHSDFVVGKKLTLADIVLYEGTQTLAQNYPDLLDKFPEIKTFRARTEQVDGLRQYLTSRPRMDF